MWTRKLSSYAIASFAAVLLQGTTSDGEALTGCGGPPPCACSYRSAFDLCVTCCGDEGQAVCPSGGACKSGLHYDGSTLHCEKDCSWGQSSFGNCCGDVGQVICDVLSGYGSCKPGLHYDGGTTHCELPCSWGTSSFGTCCGDVDQAHCDPLSDKGAGCKDGLAEGDFTCRTPRVPGETCGPDYPCKDGSSCNFAIVDGDLKLTCVLDEGSELVGDPDTCRAFYSSDVASGAVSGDATLSFGIGANAVAGISGTIEEGVFYTEDSRYGCYVTTCLGAETNIGVSAYIVVGETNTYDDFKGHSFVINELAGIDVVSYINSQGWNSHNDFLSGDAPTSASQAVAFGLDLIPISVGASECDTITQLVIGEETVTPPVALCKNVQVLADSTCAAPASVDAGSYSPTTGVTLTTTQSPAGPYPIGVTPVTLTATDSNGQTATCTATVDVHDVTPPVITCPPNVSVPNAPARCAAEVDLPLPAAADACSAIAAVWTVPASGATLPVGEHVVYGMATDAHENPAACTFTATVVDAESPSLTAPPDQVVDATGPDGAVVTYDPFSAGDNCAVVSVTSDPPSGSTFPIDAPGEVTVVTGVAKDAAGNTTVATFDVHVKGAVEQLVDLLALVETLPHHEGLEHEVHRALRAAEAGWTRRACQALWEITEEISERDEHACVPWGREVLLAPVTRIRAVLACPAREECEDDGRVASAP